MRLTILLLLPILAGCTDYTIVENHPHTIPVGEKPSLVVEMVNGPIDVKMVPGKELFATLTKRGVGKDKEAAEREIAAIDFEIKPDDNGKISIRSKRVEGSYWGSSGTQAELKVPVGAKLELITSNGSISIDGSAAQVQAKTKNGAVKIAGVKCPIDVSTSNGSVTAEDVTGRVKIDTSNGRISVHGTRLELLCKTSNGTIQQSGGLAAGKHQLTTSNGKIEVVLPSDTRLTLDASTSNGKVNSEFKLDNRKASKRTLSGVIGSDGNDTTLTLKSSNGSIHIKKGDRAVASGPTDDDED
jgi:DUF4097 and DUF4098 domain-containing protein YvlB